MESVWPVILDSYQRFCPTVVEAGENVTLEDYKNALHQMVEKAYLLFTCLVSDETMPNKMHVLFATLAVSVYSSLREVGETTIEL